MRKYIEGESTMSEQVKIQGTPYVKIKDTPHVRIKDAPHVRIKDIPHVRIKGNPHVKVRTHNRSSFKARIVSAPTIGARLPNIQIPSGFAISVRAHVDNQGQVFIANSISHATTPGVPGKRITLNAGDVSKLFITNAKKIFVAGSESGQNVDILVEK